MLGWFVVELILEAKSFNKSNLSLSLFFNNIMLYQERDNIFLLNC